jgi:hypothetical protein
MVSKVTWETEDIDCGSCDGDVDYWGTWIGTMLGLSEEEDCADETVG